MRVFLVAAVLLGTTTAAVAAEQAPTIADLDALAGQKAWAELLQKAQDLPAAKRDPHWQALVNQAAEARVNDTTLPDRTVTTDSIALLLAYPGLTNDRAFLEARNRRAMVAIRQCFADSPYDASPCRDVLNNVVRSDPKNAELARDGALLVWRSFTRKGESIDAYDVALHAARERGAAGATLTKELCGSKELEAALADAVGNDCEATRLTRAKVIAFDWCWSALDQKKLANAIVESDAGRANACTELLGKKILGGVNETKCKNLGKK